MAELAPASAAEIKACCAALHQSQWARLLLGDSFHPGGMALTERLGAMLGLGPHTLLLDVAAGNGSSALFLAQRFGCRVVGLEYGELAVVEANRRGAEASDPRVRFIRGDGEHVPLESGAFDAIICECSFCTFPNKPSAAKEFARVLRPGGKVGLADLTRNGPLSPALQTLPAWTSCLGDARPVQDYLGSLAEAGPSGAVVEPHDEALRDLVHSVRGKLLGAELLMALGKLTLPAGDLEEGKQLAKAAAAAIARGELGYSLMVATRD